MDSDLQKKKVVLLGIMKDITDCLRHVEVCAPAYFVDCALVQPHLTEAFESLINCHFLQIKLL